MAKEDLPILGTVRAIKRGHNGPYFLAECEIGMVSVSLLYPVWQEIDQARGGSIVIISDIRMEVRGWRGYCARFFRPGDEI